LAGWDAWCLADANMQEHGMEKRQQHRSRALTGREKEIFSEKRKKEGKAASSVHSCVYLQ